MNYPGVVWQENVVTQSPAAALATESGRQTARIQSLHRQHSAILTKILYLRGRAFAYPEFWKWWRWKIVSATSCPALPIGSAKES